MSNWECSFIIQPSRSHHGEHSPSALAASSFPGKLYNLAPLLALELLQPERNLVKDIELAEKTLWVSLVSLNLLTPQPDEFLIVERKQERTAGANKRMISSTFRLTQLYGPISHYVSGRPTEADVSANLIFTHMEAGRYEKNESNEWRENGASCYSKPAFLSSLCYQSSLRHYMNN